MTTTESTAYETDLDLFSDEVLLEPFEHYRELRDMGPVVYLKKYDLYGLFRYDQVRNALNNWEVFSSAQGVALNPIANEAWKNSILCMDPPEHRKIRKVFDDALRPKFIRKVAGDIEQQAETLVDELVQRGEFDGVTDFAHKLPVSIVMDLVGFPRDEGRDKILGWAVNSFNFAGPPGERQTASLPLAQAQLEYLINNAKPENLLPDSFGKVVYAAADRGEITHEEAVTMMLGYANAGLDTTINAVGSTLWLLARKPDQWDAIRQDPKLVPSAFLEGIRLESPAQFFSRVTTEDADVDGVTIPRGSRVLHSYASANRDERHYPNPDTFDARRNPVDILAFDSGIHTCPGRTLASMEGHALFTALAKRVSKIELTGEPTRTPNSITRGLDTLPIRVS
ncbi:cytochrome P450 [Amycolatopsis deserti]|uniref:cytochrome P450 n=1 Tax=Amycolatopsis deserti TaxID=185696 RepID=UPI001E361235|nr:cytochrome P450 [Amycolatopsis deserti]